MSRYDDALVSAVIITYKRPIEILKRAVMSALKQTHQNMEVIVVNDYPEDITSVNEIQNMLNDFNDVRIKYIVHEKNAGACKARNTGITASTGEFVALLDDDDEWLEDKTEKQLEGFISENIGMVYSPFYDVIKDLPGKVTVRGTKSGDLVNDLLYTNCVGGSSMTLMRREVFDKCGLFDEGLLSSQDYDMWLRIALKYEIACVNEPLTRRFLLEESITMNFNKQKQGFERFMEKFSDLYNKNPDAYNYQLNRKVNKFLEKRNISDAWLLWCKAIKSKPISKYNFTEPCKGIIKFIIGKEINE